LGFFGKIENTAKDIFLDIIEFNSPPLINSFCDGHGPVDMIGLEAAGASPYETGNEVALIS